MHPRASDLTHKPMSRTSPSVEAWAKQAQLSFGRLLTMLQQQPMEPRPGSSRAPSSGGTRAHVPSQRDDQAAAGYGSTTNERHRDEEKADGNMPSLRLMASMASKLPYSHKPLRSSENARSPAHVAFPGIFKSHKYVKRRHARASHAPPKAGQWYAADIVRETPEALSQRLSAAVNRSQTTQPSAQANTGLREQPRLEGGTRTKVDQSKSVERENA